MHGNGGDFIVVSRVVLDEEVRAHVPHLHSAVCAAGRQALTLRVEGDGVHHTNDMKRKKIYNIR